MTKDQLLSKVKFQYVIEDPFPQHTSYERLGGLLRIYVEKPEEISIWEAYRIGQESVYKRIEALEDF